MRIQISRFILLFFIVFFITSCTSSSKEENTFVAAKEGGNSASGDSNINPPQSSTDSSDSSDSSSNSSTSPGASSGGYGRQGIIRGARTGNPDRDLCPEDPDKLEPRVCGCGVPDDDSDGDGLYDCIDNCPQVFNEDQADADGDGVGTVCDCIDNDADITVPIVGPSGIACDTGELSPCAEGEIVCTDGNIDCLPIVPECEGEILLFETTFGTNNTPEDIACGDINNDGSNDLVANSDADNNISVVFNNGDGTFGVPTIYGNGTLDAPFRVKLADFNGDSYLDIATANTVAGSLSHVFFNTGAGAFMLNATYLNGAQSAFAIDVGNLNTGIDLAVDIVLAGRGPNELVVLLNTGAGTFAAPVGYATAVGSTTGVTLGDVDNDGDLDAALTGDAGTGMVAIFRNNGNGTFAAEEPYSVTGSISPNAPQLGDVNNDGYLDLIIVSSSTATVYVLYNNNDGTFAAPVEFPSAGVSASLKLSDVDGNGSLDIVLGIIPALGKVAVLLNDGDGAFPGPAFVYGSGGTSGIDVCDVNGDARPDAVATGSALIFANIYTPTCPCIEFWSQGNDIAVQFPADYEEVNNQCFAGNDQVLLTYQKNGNANIAVGLLDDGEVFAGPVCHVSDGDQQQVRELPVTVPTDSSFEQLVDSCREYIYGNVGSITGDCGDNVAFCPCNEFWHSGNNIAVRFPDDYEAVNNQCLADSEQVLLTYTKNGNANIAVGFLDDGNVFPGPVCYVSDGDQQQARELSVTIPSGVTVQDVINECRQDLADKAGSIPGNCSFK